MKNGVKFQFILFNRHRLLYSIRICNLKMPPYILLHICTPLLQCKSVEGFSPTWAIFAFWRSMTGLIPSCDIFLNYHYQSFLLSHFFGSLRQQARGPKNVSVVNASQDFSPSFTLKKQPLLTKHKICQTTKILVMRKIWFAFYFTQQNMLIPTVKSISRKYLVGLSGQI